MNDLKAWVKALFYTRNEVDQRQAAHTVLTAAHGATGAVVGTTNAQTLTNKTLTSPVITGSTGAWIALPLNTAGAWADFGSGQQAAEYKKVGDIVFVRGFVKRTSGGDATIATLPAGYRPLATYNCIVAGDDAFARIGFATDGTIVLNEGTAVSYLQLNNIWLSVI